jgi:hypothetical protein
MTAENGETDRVTWSCLTNDCCHPLAYKNQQIGTCLATHPQDVIVTPCIRQSDSSLPTAPTAAQSHQRFRPRVSRTALTASSRLTSRSLTGDKLSISIIDNQLWKPTKAQHTFTIHESLLDLNGTLLSMASQSGNQEPPYKLTEFSIRSFALYVNWLYTRRLNMTKLSDEEEKDRFEKLGEAFALGYCIQEMDFQIAIVDEILKFAQELDDFPGYELTDIVYRSYDCEALRGLMVDLWAWKATARWDAVASVYCIARDDIEYGDFERMFAVDLCKALVRVRPVPGQGVSDRQEALGERREVLHECPRADLGESRCTLPEEFDRGHG